MSQMLSSGARVLAGTAALLLAFGGAATAAPKAPSAITIGTLYSGSGNFAVASQNELHGLKYWANNVNKNGGVMVKAFNKKIPIKIISYDDQSSTATATTLYNQLITRDKVNVLMADFGSVLTSVAVPLAQEHHQLLIDVTGSSASFFTKKTNYLADVSVPDSGIWPVPLGKFLLKHHIKRIAILYCANDFDGSQAHTLKSVLVKGGEKPIYFNAVPTKESNYLVLLHTIAAKKPGAVIELGYLDNDIAFMRALSNSGLHFKMTFTVFPGQLRALLVKNVGSKILRYVYTYPTPPQLKYAKTTLGPNTAQFVKAWKAANKGQMPNFLNSAGYNAGLIVQGMLAKSNKFTQKSFHQALMNMSGKTTTILGNFRINADGAQIGEQMAVAQLVPKNGKNKLVIVAPPKKATGKAVYPAPGS